MEETHAAIIQSDMECSGCRYDLRGMPADGRCPECGQAIAITLLATLEKTGAVTLRPALTRKVRAALRDGLILLLLSAATCVAIAMAPDSWLRFKTPERTI